jgi:hypothetical protein
MNYELKMKSKRVAASEGLDWHWGEYGRILCVNFVRFVVQFDRQSFDKQ